MSMSKKHYEQIADSLSINVRYEGYSDYRVMYDRLLNDLCLIFERDNPSFNATLFRERANVRKESK
jgi:hypothetical protein